MTEHIEHDFTKKIRASLLLPDTLHFLSGVFSHPQRPYDIFIPNSLSNPWNVRVRANRSTQPWHPLGYYQMSS